MTAPAPIFRQVCQLTGEIADPPKVSGAGAHTLAPDRPAPDSPPLSGAGHLTN